MRAANGTLVTYSFVVSNGGDVALTNVVVEDPLLSFNQNVGDLAAGQSVTFSGGATSSFGVHPLSPGALNSPRAGTAGNPIQRLTDGNMREVTVTFPSAGTFPYICEAHASTGMTGVVRVQ